MPRVRPRMIAVKQRWAQYSQGEKFAGWQVLFSLFDLEAAVTVTPAQPAPLFIADVNGTAAKTPPAGRAPPPGRKVAAGSSTASTPPPAKPSASKGGPGEQTACRTQIRLTRCKRRHEVWHPHQLLCQCTARQPLFSRL